MMNWNKETIYIKRTSVKFIRKLYNSNLQKPVAQSQPQDHIYNLHTWIYSFVAL